MGQRTKARKGRDEYRIKLSGKRAVHNEDKRDKRSSRKGEKIGSCRRDVQGTKHGLIFNSRVGRRTMMMLKSLSGSRTLRFFDKYPIGSSGFVVVTLSKKSLDTKGDVGNDRWWPFELGVEQLRG